MLRLVWLSLYICMPFFVWGQTTYMQMGLASFYSDRFHGRITTSGEQYNKNAFTAAHPSLEFGTMVRVRNLANGREAIVRINDRGPYAHNRIIDVSKAAAHKLDFILNGTSLVKIEVVETPADTLPPPLDLPVLAAARKSAPEVSPPPAHSDWSLFFSKTEIFQKGTYDMKGQLTPLEERYGAQVGSFTDLENAVVLCRDLENAGIQNIYLQVSPMSDNIVFYRVVVGNYASRAESNEKLDMLSNRGFDGFTVKHY